jgi:alkanesulfonate monooxygenase SsuD/methylene tetrahydromethanopterin reductase-like flavin-dependent oxidoreductase (luciferase family)
VKLGILVETEDGLTWDRWRRVVDATEDLGFDSVWISDHLQSSGGEDRGGLDAWLALTDAAARTRRVTLGPLVTPITFRAPGVLARMTANLHSLTEGRFVLGLGVGWNAREHAAFGIPFPPGTQRLHLLDTGLDLIRRLMADRVPVLIGGMGRRTLRLVARHADEWNLTTNDLTWYQAAAEQLDRSCQVVRRDPASIRRSVAVGVLVGRDPAELGARSAAMRRLVPELSDVPTEGMLDAVRARGWVAGTPDEIVAALAGLAAAGVDRAMLGHYDQDDTAALELIARDVLPAVG